MNFQEKWRKLLLPLRYGGSGVNFKKLDPARSPFLQDRDRIIYSSSFRRLARKTQVHPLVRAAGVCRAGVSRPDPRSRLPGPRHRQSAFRPCGRVRHP